MRLALLLFLCTGMLLGCGPYLPPVNPGANSCLERAESVHRGWSPQVRQVVEQGIADAAPPWSADIAKRTVARLDKFTETLSGLQEKNCGRGGSALELAEVAQVRRCLESYAISHSTLVQALQRPRRSSLEHVIGAVLTLDEGARTCLVPPPNGPKDPLAVAPTADLARRLLAEALVHRYLKDEQARTSSIKAREASEASGSWQLLLQALVAEAHVQFAQRDIAGATSSAEHARMLAEGRHDRAWTVAVLDVLASLQESGAHFAQATELRARAVRICRKLYGNIALPTARAQHALGASLDGKGAYDEALQQFLDASSTFERKLEKDDPWVAVGYESIADLHRRKGDAASARPLNERVLAARLTAYGEHHPATARAYNNLGGLEAHDARHAKALVYYQRAAQILERMLDPNDWRLAEAYNLLGSAYNSLGNYPNSIQLLKRALAIAERRLGEQHPLVGLYHGNLGAVLLGQRERRDAVLHLERAIAIAERVHPEGHPDTATYYSTLGSAYIGLREVDKAILIQKKALLIRRSMLGFGHPDTAESLAKLGEAMTDKGEYKRAAGFLERALRIEEKVHGPEHPYTAAVLAFLGDAYLAKGEPKQALAYYQRVIDIRERALGTSHPHTARGYGDLRNVYHALHDESRAIEFGLKEVAAMERARGPHHTELAVAQDNLGALYYWTRKYPEALQHFRAGLAIFERAVGRDDPDAKVAIEWIAGVCSKGYKPACAAAP